MEDQDSMVVDDLCNAPQPVTGSVDSDKVAKLQQLIDRTARYSELLAESSVTTVMYGAPAEAAASGAPAAPAAMAQKGKKGGDLAGKLHTLSGKQGVAPPQSSLGQPPTVTGGQLRSYQLDALNWLIGHFENGINAILADEMGLGKTVTTIALVGHLWHMGVRGPFLVVAPVSTLANWVGEFERWAPTLPVLLYHGAPDERERLRDALLQMTRKPPARNAMKRLTDKKRKSASGAASPVEASLSPALAEAMKNKQLPIVVTSYEIAIRDIRFLRQHHWKYMVVDEAHRLKNFECKLICELRTLTTESRLLLTGTPLQNNLTELWSLLNFLLPDIFGNLGDFKQWFDFTNLIESNSDASQQLHGDLVTKLHSLMRPFFLRRLKQDVESGLPKKQEVVVYASTTAVQRTLYDAIKERTLKLRHVSLNNLVMQLRKVCNHPFLFDEEVIKRVFESTAEDDVTAGDSDSDDKVANGDEETPTDISARLRSRKRSTPDGEEKKPIYVEDDEEDEDALDDDEFEKRLLESCVVHAAPPKSSSTSPAPEPKRRRSAYNIFSSECWAQIRLSGRKIDRDDLPNFVRDIAARWNSLSGEDRVKYEERANMEAAAQDALLGDVGGTALRSVEELANSSGKMQLLHKMLPELKRKGHRVLIFSQMTRVLDLIEEYIIQAGHVYCRIDGSVAQGDRQAQIDEFTNNKDIFCFLLSTRAGGQGINLMAADTVIIYDSDWNPQMDLQAMDRCHRIGQTKPVVVYRLITGNTVDSRILSRAREKLMLERLVVGKGGFNRKTSATTLTDEELRDMLRWRAGEGGERAVTDEELNRLLERDAVFRDAEAAQKPASPNPTSSPSPSQSLTPAPEKHAPAPAGFVFVTTTRGQL